MKHITTGLCMILQSRQLRKINPSIDVRSWLVCQAGQEWWGDVEMAIGKWLSFGWVSILFVCLICWQLVFLSVYLSLAELYFHAKWPLTWQDTDQNALIDFLGFEALEQGVEMNFNVEVFAEFLNLVSKLWHGMLHKTPCSLKLSFLWFEDHWNGLVRS